jgi:hypothetical protein
MLSAVIRGSNELEDFRCHRGVKVTDSVTSIYFPYYHIFIFFLFILLLSVKHVMGVTLVTCHTCHEYHCHVSLVIKFVIESLLVTDFH